MKNKQNALKAKLGQFKGALVIGAVSLTSVGAFASGTTSIAVPTPDYTNFYNIAGVAIAVGLVVMLAKRAKSFLR